jgi:hypothetical protein
MGEDDHFLTSLQSIDNFEYFVDLRGAIIAIEEVIVHFLPNYITWAESRYRSV